MTGRTEERHQFGHTMIELIIVLALLGLVLALTLPRMNLAPPLSSAGRSLIGLMHTLVAAASSSKTHYRLYLDFEQRSYWVMAVAPDGERAPSNASLAHPMTLPAGVRFLDAVVGPRERVQSGRVDISFYPTGRVDRSLIHLIDGAGDMLTVGLDPLTASVKTWDGYREPIAPAPVPESFRPWLIASPQSPSGASQGNGSMEQGAPGVPSSTSAPAGFPAPPTPVSSAPPQLAPHGIPYK